MRASPGLKWEENVQAKKVHLTHVPRMPSAKGR